MYDSIELIFWGKCTLQCKYCYVHPHLDNFPDIKSDWYHKVENLLGYINKYNVSRLEMFGGEILVRDVGIDILELLLEKTKFPIIIPTNGTWVLYNDKFDRVVNLLEKYGRSRLAFSFSTDGLYGDSSRWVSKQPPQEYYTRMFDIAKKYGYGFHPMIHSSNIDTWKKNFDWFIDMYGSYSLPLQTLYLLEVRNYDWSLSDCYKLYELMVYIVEKLYQIFGDGLVDFIKDSGLNILRGFLGSMHKGLGCSMPTTLPIRVADYAIPICHRLMYPQFIFGYIDPSTNEINWVDKKFYEFVKFFDYKEQPVCTTCMIKHICSLGCIGSQFECTRDLFMPIPTVCRMEHFKLAGIIEGFMRVGIFTKLCKWTNDANLNSILNLKEMLNGLSRY